MITGMKLSEKAQFVVDNLDLEKASGVDGARYEQFQIDHLCSQSTFRIAAKSRQIAYSFLFAMEGVLDALLEARDSIVISLNIDESQEKIRYAKRIYENFRISGLPKLIRESLTDMEFENGARITSITARAPRGRARSNVFL